MLRMGLLVMVMVLVTQTPQSVPALHDYKYYVVIVLMSLLIKPWLTRRFD